MTTVKDLERRLTLVPVVGICIGAMMGSGIFVLPGVVFATTGPSVWLAYFLAAIGTLPAAISRAELATAMPTSGGTYVFLERTFGPLVGTLAGIGLWLSILFKAAFALIGIGAYLAVLADVPLKPVALAVTTLIILLNLLGVGKVSGAVMAVVIISVSAFSGLSIAGLIDLRPGSFEPFFPFGMEGILAASGMVFVSYAGVIKIAAIAEEIKRPERTIPLAILISLGVVTLLYCLISFVMVGRLAPEALAGDLKPVHSLAFVLGGKYLGWLIAVVAILTLASMANAGLLAASRFPFAMSRDRLLPSALGRLNERFVTPVASILLSGLTLAVAIALLDVERLAKLASAFLIAIYVVENVAVIVLRETRVQWYTPTFRSPLYPGLQIFGIIIGAVLLLEMGSTLLAATMMAAGPGLLLYFAYSRKRTERRGVLGVRGRRPDLVEAKKGAIPMAPEEELPDEAKVVVSLFGGERSPEMLIELGLGLAGGEQVEVVHLTEVPEQTDLHDLDANESASIRSLRRRLDAMAETRRAMIHFDSVISHDIYKTVHEISWRLDCQWLVKEWGGRTSGAFTPHRPMGWLENHLACHVMTFRDAGVRYIRKILVLHPPHGKDALIVETADRLALVNQATLTFASYLPPGSEAKGATLESLARLGEGCASPVEAQVLEGPKWLKTVIEATSDFDLLVFRALPATRAFERFFGSEQDALIQGAACSVVAIKGLRLTPEDAAVEGRETIPESSAG